VDCGARRKQGNGKGIAGRGIETRVDARRIGGCTTTVIKMSLHGPVPSHKNYIPSFASTSIYLVPYTSSTSSKVMSYFPPPFITKP